MARPSKATVEYFPLVCQFGYSIQAVENLYGNDGFVVWVKLLQKLGRSENHYIDLRTNPAWKLFYSIFKVEEHVVLNILDTLAELGSIDKKLWEHKIIYSQNFVNGIADAYRNRKSVLLSYEDILRLVGVSDVRNPQEREVSDINNPVSDVRNPQSKLKETKEKEIKEYSLSLNSEDVTIISESEREILKNYILKNCKAHNVDAYLTQLLKSGDYRRILVEEMQKKKVSAAKQSTINEDIMKVKDKYTALAFIGKYGDFTDENHPALVKNIMTLYHISSYTEATQLMQEELKCRQRESYNST